LNFIKTAMRAVIQRVSRASVKIDNRIRSEIGQGLLVLAGIEESDNDSDVEWLSNKIVQLRIFNDSNGVMNLSVLETGGSVLAISQFTLHARTRKGNRPSYIRAASPEIAVPLYNNFVNRLSELLGREIGTGEFGAMMQVELVNDGPVTILIDTKEKE
jgi:D-tyrosyl-tRNA(Tyr) deacylase